MSGRGAPHPHLDGSGIADGPGGDWARLRLLGSGREEGALGMFFSRLPGFNRLVPWMAVFYGRNPWPYVELKCSALEEASFTQRTDNVLSLESSRTMPPNEQWLPVWLGLWVFFLLCALSSRFSTMSMKCSNGQRTRGKLEQNVSHPLSWPQFHTTFLWENRPSPYSEWTLPRFTLEEPSIYSLQFPLKNITNNQLKNIYWASVMGLNP